MKYSDSDFIVNSSLSRNMRRIISDFIKYTKTKYTIHSTLIITYGVIENVYLKELQSILTADDLFR